MAGLAQVLLIVDHFLEHRVHDVAQLERRGFLGQMLSIEQVRVAAKMHVSVEWRSVHR